MAITRPKISVLFPGRTAPRATSVRGSPTEHTRLGGFVGPFDRFTSPVDPGGNLTYTVTIKNNGPNNATGVTLTDTLPPTTSLSSYSSTPNGITCSGIGTVSCNIGGLSVGSEVVITLVANVPSNVIGTLINTATVSGSQPEANSANNTETINAEVNLAADLQISMTDGPDPAVLNQDQVTYTMTVTSLAGSQTVPNVTVVDTLPGSATLVAKSATTTMGTCTENGGAGLVTCDLGSMSAGNTAVITVKVNPGVKGTITNTANVNFDGTDLNPVDNKASQNTTVSVIADVSVTATDDRDPVGKKNDLSYIINVKNNGPSPSSDVTLTATLPSGVNFSSASASQGLPCGESAGVVTCDLQAMAKNAQSDGNDIRGATEYWIDSDDHHRTNRLRRDGSGPQQQQRHGKHPGGRQPVRGQRGPVHQSQRQSQSA